MSFGEAAPTSRRTAVHEWRTSGFQRSDSVGPGLHRNRSGKSGKSVEPDRSARGGKTEAVVLSRETVGLCTQHHM